MYSIEKAVEEFKAILETEPTWKELVKSQFVKHLAIFASWGLRDAQFKTERAKQEFFVSTALNRSSLIAHAEDREYLPRKPSSASGKISITNGGAAQVTLPIYTEFVNENQVPVVTMGATVIPAGATVVVDADQKQKTVITHAVTGETPFYEVLFSQEITPKVAGFSVKVDMQDGLGFKAWKYYRLLQNAYPTTRAYDEFYSHSEQIGIRFGNGEFGLMPVTGATVQIDAWESLGNVFLAQGQELFPVDELLDASGDPSVLSVVVSTALSEGQDAETTEEIRSNLHYWPVYNEELVWADDYTYFLRRRFSDLLFVKAWGEEEAEAMAGAPSLDFINKIFITAYSPTRVDTDDDCMTALGAVVKLNRKFEWVEPVHVSFTVALTGKVLPDKVLSEVENDVKEALENYYGKDSANRRDTVYLSEVYEAIQETGHFEKVTGSRFEVSLGGTYEATYLYQMVSVDLENSTFGITYL